MTTTKAFLFVAMMLRFGAANAVDCEGKEYAQYKDEAATNVGRHSLAFQYCRLEENKQAARVDIDGQGSRVFRACVAEQNKIIDALKTKAANSTIMYMLDGCTGEFPWDESATKTKRSKATP